MVYRENEAALAGAVSAAAGDVETMIDAARAFWVAPAGSEFSEALDDSTWATIVKARAGKAAIASLLELAAEKTVRFRSFLHLVQNLHLLRSAKQEPGKLHSSEVKILVDLLPRVRVAPQLSEHWAAIMVRLVEGGAPVQVRMHLEQHHEELRLDDKKWAVVGMLLATTSIHFLRVEEWLADWESRESVPMFLVCLYLEWAAQAGTDGTGADRRASAASKALEVLEPDSSEQYLRCIVMGSLLRKGKHTEFLKAVADNEDNLAQVDEDQPLRHPFGQALNRYKTWHKIVDADFHFEPPDPTLVVVMPLVGLASLAMQRGLANQRIVGCCQALGRYEFVASKSFLKVRELLVIDKKSRRFLYLSREFRKLRKPADLRWIIQEWDLLFRKRAPLRTRIRLTLLS